MLEVRKFQFVYSCSLLINKQFIRKQNGFGAEQHNFCIFVIYFIVDNFFGNLFFAFEFK